MEVHGGWKAHAVRLRTRKQLPLDLTHCSLIALWNVIRDVRTPDSILEQIAHVYYGDEEILRELVRCPNLSETTLAMIALTASDDIKTFIKATRGIDIVSGEGSAAAGVPAEKKKLNVTQIIMKMKPAQKIKLALTGAKDARSILIRESSKTVSLSVLSNPRLTIGEVESFAKSQNLSEDVIRKIGTNAEWTRKNTIAAALVFNPKTPVTISIGFMSRMTERDLSILEKSKGIAEAVRRSARHMLAKKKIGKG